MIVIRCDRLEYVQQRDRLLDHLIGAANQASRVEKVSLFDIRQRALQFEGGAFHQQFRGLMHHDERGLVFMKKLFRRFLESEQFIGAQIAFVVGRSFARKNRFSEIVLLCHRTSTQLPVFSTKKTQSLKPPNRASDKGSRILLKDWILGAGN